MNSNLPNPMLDPTLRRLLRPQRWDQVQHAPLRDTQTNELICIYLELARIVSMANPPVMFGETMEPFFLYAVQRLNALFGTTIQVQMRPMPQADGDSSIIDVQAEPVDANALSLDSDSQSPRMVLA